MWRRWHICLFLNVFVSREISDTQLKIESWQYPTASSYKSRSEGQGAALRPSWKALRELTYAPEVQETVNLDKSQSLSWGLKEEAKGMFRLAAWQQTRELCTRSGC